MQIIRSRRVVLPDGEHPAAIHIREGVIVGIGPYEEVPDSAESFDAGDLVVSPGVVDTHVHVNEPGRTEWEGFDTATRAAAAGGVTTIVDMPLNSIPATVDVAALETKRAAARGQCHVDVAFWGGIVPGRARDVRAMIDAGVRGFKCFLTPSGVDEFEHVTEGDLREALAVLASAEPPMRPLLVHAELPERLRPADDSESAAARVRYDSYLATRPVDAEVEAIRLMARLAAEYHVPTHIVHVSSAEGMAAVRRAQDEGLPMTAETCAHYLTFAAEDVPDGRTEFKCAPPLRPTRHRDALWASLSDGTCSMVVTDHSPAPRSLKCADTGDFHSAWGGIASLELSLPAVWTGAATRDCTTSDVARWMGRAPAELCGLGHRKGTIATGHDADLVVWDPDAWFSVDAERLQQRHKMTPYAGRRLRGSVHSTYVRGVCVWSNGRLARAGEGRLL